ncbi:MAG: hypothetical protein ACI83D_000296 [Planctomycetota bacterium]|jgi:hypothetical protein
MYSMNIEVNLEQGNSSESRDGKSEAQSLLESLHLSPSQMQEKIDEYIQDGLLTLEEVNGNQKLYSKCFEQLESHITNLNSDFRAYTEYREGMIEAGIFSETTAAPSEELKQEVRSQLEYFLLQSQFGFNDYDEYKAKAIKAGILEEGETEIGVRLKAELITYLQDCKNSTSDMREMMDKILERKLMTSEEITSNAQLIKSIKDQAKHHMTGDGSKNMYQPYKEGMEELGFDLGS